MSDLSSQMIEGRVSWMYVTFFELSASLARTTMSYLKFWMFDSYLFKWVLHVFDEDRMWAICDSF
jgi:hypothetical protein